jgi:hypothetical protein
MFFFKGESGFCTANLSGFQKRLIAFFSPTFIVTLAFDLEEE